MFYAYELTKDGYIQYNLDVMDISPSMRRTKTFMKWIIPLIYLGLPFILVRFTSVPFIFWAVSMFITGLLWLILFPMYFKWTIKKRIEKLLGEGSTAAFIGPHTLYLEEDGLRDVTIHGENRIAYSTIIRLIETRDMLYVFISPVLAFVIPKSHSEQEGNLSVDGLKMTLTGFTQKQWETLKN